MSMQPVKTYTHLDKKERMFGIEVLDFLLLAVVYAVVFTVSRNIFINIAVVVAVYVGLRLYKRGKPQGYTATLVRFWLTPKFYTLSGRE